MKPHEFATLVLKAQEHRENSYVLDQGMSMGGFATSQTTAAINALEDQGGFGSRDWATVIALLNEHCWDDIAEWANWTLSGEHGPKD